MPKDRAVVQDDEGGVQEMKRERASVRDSCTGRGRRPKLIAVGFLCQIRAWARGAGGGLIRIRNKTEPLRTHWNRRWWDSGTPKKRPAMVNKPNCKVKKTG